MALFIRSYLRVTNYDHFTTSLVTIGFDGIQLLKDILGGTDWIDILFNWRPVLLDLIATKSRCRWTLRLLLSNSIGNLEGLVAIRAGLNLLSFRNLNRGGATIVVHWRLDVLAHFSML